MIYLFKIVLIVAMAWPMPFVSKKFAWDPSVGAESYKIYWKTSQTSIWYVYGPNIPAPTTTFTASLLKGNKAWFAVSAVNSVGESDKSNVLEVDFN